MAEPRRSLAARRSTGTPRPLPHGRRTAAGEGRKSRAGGAFALPVPARRCPVCGRRGGPGPAPRPRGSAAAAGDSAPAAMGCLQSVACKARVRREQIVVSDVSATIEPAATAIEESSPVVLRYRTPYFRASARVLMPPIARRHTWVVGWIQACNHMEFYNTYSDLGVSSWELPDLREGRVKAISDSDGVSYPWYGNTTETVTLVGPTNKISRFSSDARSMSTIEPCLWQTLLSIQLEVEGETVPAGCGGSCGDPSHRGVGVLWCL
ncbi:protein FAM78B isoform X3 [Cuculus canorus]|uniref:protein FAM78B isoform X3 n=1 Tax=Cuculus canorus TaxID=55661 RepID=UPI0023AB1F36|nr:protein FAM78B isoform X3 [Cuculus canorus]